MDAPVPAPIAEKPDQPPLLPPFLLSPATFLWLWVLPIAVLMALNAQGYWLVEGNLNAEQRGSAVGLGLAGLANLLAGVGLYGFTRMRQRAAGARPVRPVYLDATAVAVQVAYLWFAATLLDEILPANVVAWIYPPGRYLFNQFSFAMLPLFFGIFRLACAGRPGRAGRALAISLGLAVAAPVLLYLCFELLRLVGGRGDLGWVAFAISVTLLGLVMFVAIVRGLMLGMRALRGSGETGERAAIVVFALGLPVAGMLLNRSIPFPVDFQAWEVYGLVVANAAILLAAAWCHTRRPALCFCLLSGTFPFSLYFFVVFLPYTPLSILAVIVLGVGFLVLTPTILFTLHLHLLNRAWRNPAMAGRRPRLLLAGVVCGLALPAFFTGRGLADKAALKAALDYVYTPAITSAGATYPASLGNLRRALASHRSYKNGIYYPLLSDYYAWLVFDNLVLPDEKLDRVEKMFFGAAGSNVSLDPVRQGAGFWGGRSGVRARTHMPRVAALSQNVEVSSLAMRASPAGPADSTVTLALTLQGSRATGSEFVQVLPLPAGAFVTGFRLVTKGVAAPGRIFEKKTALWVYEMIRDTERRDPGLLFYRGPDELELRVFPVVFGTPVTAEIDFLVPGIVSATDLATPAGDPVGALAGLGRILPAQLARDRRGCLAITGSAERQLPAVKREPYLHLIVDRSVDNGYTGDLAAALRTLKERFPAARSVRVTDANYNVVDRVSRLTPFEDLAVGNSAALRPALPLSGGLAFDLALAHALRLHLEQELDQAPDRPVLPPRPVFVILSHTASMRALDLDAAREWADLVPDLEICELGSDGRMVTRLGGDAADAPLLRLGNSVRSARPGHAVRFKPSDVGRVEFWSPATAEWSAVPNVAAAAAGSPWLRAATLQLQQQDQARSPGDSEVNLKALVGASREAGLLLASTSYIVVENAAQWRMLDLSERLKLSQNAALGFLETPAPPTLYVAAGFLLWLCLRRARGLRRIRSAA